MATLPATDKVGTPVADALIFKFDRERENAADALEELINKASRELETLRTSANFTRTDWVEQPAARYHEAMQRMIALSDALAIAMHLEKEAD